jgi:putative transposase
MNKARPVVRESPETLKVMLRHETDRRKKQRLHALYLIASEQASNRQEVAHLLGISRNTVGRWLTDYSEGGLKALLNVYVPQGKQSNLSDEVIAHLKQALQRPERFSSYDDVRVWLEDTHGVSIKYTTLYKLIRYKLKARIKPSRHSRAQEKGR